MLVQTVAWQKELVLHLYAGGIVAHHARVGWTETSGRLNLVKSDRSIERVWRKPYEYYSVRRLGSMSQIDPASWDDFLDWAIDQRGRDFPYLPWLMSPRDLIVHGVPEEGVLREFTFKRTNRKVVGIVVEKTVFFPHFADERQWWKASVDKVISGRKIARVFELLEADMEVELLRLVRRLPESLAEIKARNLILSL